METICALIIHLFAQRQTLVNKEEEEQEPVQNVGRQPATDCVIERTETSGEIAVRTPEYRDFLE